MGQVTGGMSPLFDPMDKGQYLPNSAGIYHGNHGLVIHDKPSRNDPRNHQSPENLPFFDRPRSLSMPVLLSDEAAILFPTSGNSRPIDLVNYSSVSHQLPRYAPDHYQVKSRTPVSHEVLSIHFIVGIKTVMKIPIQHPETITGDWLRERFFSSKQATAGLPAEGK